MAHIDADGSSSAADLVLAELAAGAPQPALAIRQGRRYVEAFEPVPIRAVKPPADLPASPVVLITGGLGYMGINLAEALFTKARAKLILLGRSSLPEAKEWAAKSEDADTPDQQKELLKRLSKMRLARDEVMVVAADMNDASQVRAAVGAGIARFGQIDIAIHGAARIDAAAFGSVAETGWNIVDAQFSPNSVGCGT